MRMVKTGYVHESEGVGAGMTIAGGGMGSGSGAGNRGAGTGGTASGDSEQSAAKRGRRSHPCSVISRPRPLSVE